MFINLKAAFDSVDRAALWKSLEGIGAPAAILDFVRDLYSHTTSRVHVSDEFSPVISTTSGVRQGCVLAPDLFLRAIDWLMSRVKSAARELGYAWARTLLMISTTLMTALCCPQLEP